MEEFCQKGFDILGMLTVGTLRVRYSLADRKHMLITSDLCMKLSRESGEAPWAR